jgi:hypothetical protein
MGGLSTSQFNMPMKASVGDFDRFTKSVSKISAQSKARKDAARGVEAAAAAEQEHAGWAASKGYTEQKRADLGFDSWTQLKKWHESQDTNVARTRQRAAIRKANPGVKADARNAKRRELNASKKAAASSTAPTPAEPKWNPLRNVKPKPAAPAAKPTPATKPAAKPKAAPKPAAPKAPAPKPKPTPKPKG